MSTPRSRVMVSVTLTSEEYEAVKLAAAKAGQSIHAFNQQAIIERANELAGEEDWFCGEQKDTDR